MSTIERTLGANLTDAIHHAHHTIAKKLANETPLTGFNRPERQVLMLENEANNALEKVCIYFVKAQAILLSSLKTLFSARPDVNLEKILKEFEQVVDLAYRTIFAPLVGHKRWKKFSRGPEPSAISEETFSTLYEASRYLMQEKRFQDATTVFCLLCSAQPNDYDYWAGYGHAAYFSGQYDTAVLAYYMSERLSPQNPWPLIWAANACEAANEWDAAITLLKQAHQFATDRNIENKTADTATLGSVIQKKLLSLTSKKNRAGRVGPDHL